MFASLSRTAIPRTSTRCFSASARTSAEVNAAVFLEDKAGELVPAAANAVTAAKKLGGKVTGILIGKDEASLEKAIAMSRKCVAPPSPSGSPGNLSRRQGRAVGTRAGIQEPRRSCGSGRSTQPSALVEGAKPAHFSARRLVLEPMWRIGRRARPARRPSSTQLQQEHMS